MTSLGRYCRYSGGCPQCSNCWGFCNACVKVREGKMEDDRGLVKDVEGSRALGCVGA